MSWGNTGSIIEPGVLREVMRATIDELYKHYGK